MIGGASFEVQLLERELSSCAPPTRRSRRPWRFASLSGHLADALLLQHSPR
jgi:hypothetical protein